MTNLGRSLFLTLSLLVLSISSAEANTKSKSCDDIIKRFEPLARPAPRRWQKIDEFLRKKVEGQKNPFEGSERDANAVGRVHMKLAESLPVYRQITAMNEKDQVSLNEFLKLKRTFDQYVSAAVKKSPSSNEAFALIEANRLLAQIEARVDFPVQTPQDDNKEEESKEDEEEKKKEKKPKQPAKFPKNDDDQYDPENKDVSSDGGSQEVVHIVETTVNPPKRLLRARAYDYVGLDKWSAVATDRPVDKEIKHTEEYMRIRPLGETQLRVFYNYDNYTPRVGTYKGYSVVEVLPGEYQLQIQSPLDEILLPLSRRSPGQFRNGTNTASYTQKLNIPIQSWPQNIQNFIKANQGQSGLAIAEKLVQFLSSKEGDFLYYSVGDKVNKKQFAELKKKLEELQGQMAKPLAMAHLGSFNCDGAAWIATLILREYFGVPTRPAAGVTVAGFKQKQGRPVYVVRSSDPLHAWIEVFDGQFWRPLDPTPKANNPTMGENENDDSEKLEQLEEAEESDGAPGEEGESESESSGEGKSKEQKEKEAKEAKDKKEKEAKDKKDQEAKEKGDKKDEKGSDEKEGELIESGLSEKLNEQAGQAGKGQGQSMSFLRRYEQFLLESYFEEGNRDKWMGRLDQLKGVLKRSDARAEILRIRARLVEISKSGRGLCDDGLIICLRNAQFLLSKGQARESFKILRALVTQMDDLARVRTFSASEAEFYRQLQFILTSYRKFNHKNAQSYDLVERFLYSLPGKLSQGLLMQRYGITSLSPDSIEVTNLADDLLAGKLIAFQRLAAAREFVDFALRGMFLPQAREVLRYQRSLDPRARQSIVVARSPLEIARMLLQPRPGEHLLEPLIQGRQFAIGPRASTLTPDPKTPIERKLSVVFYDTSGSMGDGAKNVYMAAVLAAFTEISLLQEDQLGRPSHEVILVPFDSTVGTPVTVKTPADALKVITSLIGHQTPATGGTDIQLAIMEFYRLVGEALRDKAKNSPFQQFQHANLILASDGGSTVDLAALEQARNKIDPNLNINMSFVAVGETNESLAQLAQESSISTTKPNYIELMGEMMGQLEASYKNIKKDKDAFATTESTYSIQREVGPLLTDLQKKSVQSRRLVTATDLQALLAAVKDGGNLEEVQRAGKEVEVKIMLENLKSLERATFEPEERYVLAYDLVTSHVKDQGRPLSRMTVTEEIELKRFLKWAIK
jgi:hypothetical protein